ncbi:MAG: T9SS type A sorting domain-containing protein [Cyclobacteriaceae bacterium]
MKGRHIWLLALLIVVFSSQKNRIEYTNSFKRPGSSLPIQEKIDLRSSYWEAMLANPKTGKVPKNIASKELRFAERLPTVKQLSKSSEGRLSQQEWASQGPFNVGGRTRGIALDIRNESVIVAGGVSGSIWKSLNEGRSWQKMSPPSIRNSISCLTQDTRPGKEDIWYFGTGELLGNSARSLGAPYRGDGLYKSLNSGDTWLPLGNTNAASPERFSNQFQYSWEIIVNKLRTDIDQVFLAAYGAILKSNDGGENWELVLGEKLFDLPDTANLNSSISPFYTNIRQMEKGYLIATLSSATSNNAELYRNAGIYFSETGEQWHAIQDESFPEYHERTVIGVDNTNDILYFYTQGDDENVTLFKYELTSLSNGIPSGNWEDLSQNLPPTSEGVDGLNTQFGYNMLIEVHPENPQTIYLGATNLFRSNDGFSTPNNYDWIGGYQSSSARYPGHHPDQHKIIFYPSNPRIMLTANDGGVFKTQNNLQDSIRWNTLNNGYLTSQFFTIHQQKKSNDHRISGGLQDNGTYLKSSSTTSSAWTRIVGGDGGYGALTAFDDLIYGSFQNGQVYRFNLTENSSLRAFTRVDPLNGGETEGQEYLFINPWTLDPNNENIMYLLGGDVVWRNLNLIQIPWGSQKKTTVNWERINGSEFTYGLYTAIAKAHSEDILYAAYTAKSPGILKITNASRPNNYATTRIEPSIFPAGGHISCVAVNPTNANELLVIFSNYEVPSIFYSVDGGESFLDVSGNMEQYANGTGNGPSIRWLEIIPTASTAIANTKYFIGTSTGLYSTTSPLTSETVWAKEAEELIGNAVITMLDYRMADGRLLAATHGSGIFSTFIDNFQPDQSSVPQNLTVKAFPNPFRSSINIEFTLPEDDFIKIEIYDRAGRFIRDILWGYQFSGTNIAKWDGTNTAGLTVDQGLYFCKIISSKNEKTQRLLFLP